MALLAKNKLAASGDKAKLHVQGTDVDSTPSTTMDEARSPSSDSLLSFPTSPTHKSTQSRTSRQSTPAALVYQQQVYAKFAESLARVQRHEQRHSLVAYNKYCLAEAKRAQSEERAFQQEARADRLSSRDEAQLSARLQHGQDVENRWQEAVAQAHARLSDRVSCRQAKIDAQEERLQKQLQVRASSQELRRCRSQERFKLWETHVDQGLRRHADRVAECQANMDAQDEQLAKRQQELHEELEEKQARLHGRFLLVQRGHDQARQDAQDKMQQLHEQLEEKLHRSRDHQDDQAQLDAEKKHAQDSKRKERERHCQHVMHKKEQTRSAKEAILDEDSRIFWESRKLQERLQVQLAQTAAGKWM